MIHNDTVILICPSVEDFIYLCIVQKIWSILFYKYVGSAIIYFRCDGVVDCMGWLREDEGLHCQRQSIQASCKDWFVKGYTQSDKYLINPQGQGTNIREFTSIQ